MNGAINMPSATFFTSRVWPVVFSYQRHLLVVSPQVIATSRQSDSQLTPLYHSDTSRRKGQLPQCATPVVFRVPPPQSSLAVIATRAGNGAQTRSYEWQ